MKLNIIAVGKLKPEFCKLFKNYVAKLSPFCKLNIIEIKGVNEKDITLKITKETALILEKIPDKEKIILCSLNGVQKSSVEFAQIFAIDNLSFVIGGSNGVDESRFYGCQKIAFSAMTFPHQLFRILLVEQIYRAFTIKKNLKYHK